MAAAAPQGANAEVAKGLTVKIDHGSGRRSAGPEFLDLVERQSFGHRRGPSSCSAHYAQFSARAIGRDVVDRPACGDPAPRPGAGPASLVRGRTRSEQVYSDTRARAANSPTIPRRNASTQATKTTPWITVTHSPNWAR